MPSDSPSTDRLFGAFLIILVAVSFATGSTLAKIAFDHGASPLSVLTCRTTMAAISVFVILKVWRIPIGLPTRVRWTAIGMGALVAVYSYGLLGSMEHIPVALAVLTFYLYPILTSVGSWVIGQESVTPRILICLVIAFIGLGLALDIGGNFNPLGISMATGAAVMFTILLLMTNHLLAEQDSRPISLHMMSSATILYLFVDLNIGAFPLPTSFEGIAAYVGSGLFFAFSIIGMFIGMARIGAVRTALFMNCEPISSIVLGALLLNQVLAPLQLVGAGVVIAAIVIAGTVREPKN